MTVQPPRLHAKCSRTRQFDHSQQTAGPSTLAVLKDADRLRRGRREWRRRRRGCGSSHRWGISVSSSGYFQVRRCASPTITPRPQPPSARRGGGRGVPLATRTAPEDRSPDGPAASRTRRLPHQRLNRTGLPPTTESAVLTIVAQRLSPGHQHVSRRNVADDSGSLDGWRATRCAGGPLSGRGDGPVARPLDLLVRAADPGSDGNPCLREDLGVVRHGLIRTVGELHGRHGAGAGGGPDDQGGAQGAATADRSSARPGTATRRPCRGCARSGRRSPARRHERSGSARR